MDGNKKVDPLSGMTTTGHEWDGIEELNHPLPRWWLYLFYITIAFAAGYWIVYPAWPLVTGYTGGVLGWHSRSAVVQDLADLKALRGPMTAKLEATPIEAVAQDSDLSAFARALGHAAFGDNCAPCHGAGGAGSKGFANLDDDDWLWGGTLADITRTITHGVRWPADDDTRLNAMPAFGNTGMLTPGAISSVADYVRSLSGLPTDPGADLAAGARVFAQTCTPCHGADGKGKHDMGGPNLTDAIWLYGSDKKTIMEGLQNGRGAVMPAWASRLDPATIKALALYVHGMGGGE